MWLVSGQCPCWRTDRNTFPPSPVSVPPPTPSISGAESFSLLLLFVFLLFCFFLYNFLFLLLCLLSSSVLFKTTLPPFPLSIPSSVNICASVIGKSIHSRCSSTTHWWIYLQQKYKQQRNSDRPVLVACRPLCQCFLCCFWTRPSAGTQRHRH